MVKRSSIKPETRRSWYRRSEHGGESVLSIAKTEGYDPRTVKRQIEMERQEMERRDARAGVMSRALERHYADLCKLTERLNQVVADGKCDDLKAVENEPLWQGLRGHLTGAPLWRRLARWKDLCLEAEAGMEGLIARWRAELEVSFPKGFVEDPHKVGTVPEAVLEFASFSRDVAMGNSDKKPGFIETGAGDGLLDIDLGRHHIARLPIAEARLLEAWVSAKVREAVGWEECRSLIRSLKELERVKHDIKNELMVVILRGVLPARCKFCPV